jgi:nucleoside-diphosphate-sugar epimerase
VTQSERSAQLLTEYRGRRVLVTGGASFLGSHLVELLLENGALVRVADDLSSGRLTNLAGVIDAIDIRIGDLRDPNRARAACQSQEMVFHLAAAHGGRGYIDSHPVECCNNLLLDHVVFAQAAVAGVTRLVFASSACTYPTVLQDDASSLHLLREDECNFDEPGKAFPDGEYGWAKLMGELQLRAFHKQFGIDAIACRIFTAYGERENESHAVIALIAKALVQLDPFPIWGDGTQTRNFTYVRDTVMGLALAGVALSGFDTINVGSSLHTSVNELIEDIFGVTGFRPRRIERQTAMPVGVKSRAADCTKSERLLGWRPSVPVHVGLDRTVEWCRKELSIDRLKSLGALLMTR